MPRNDQPGMTSLEVLCATVLASMLMSAVLGVVGGIAKRDQALARRSPEPDWARRVKRQLQEDFSQANRIEFERDGFFLYGPIGRDPASQAASWLPAAVRYRVVDGGDFELGGMLLRSEKTLDSAAADDRPEVVAFRVESVAVAESGVDHQQQPGGGFTSDLRGGVLPSQVSVSISIAGDAPLEIRCSIMRP